MAVGDIIGIVASGVSNFAATADVIPGEENDVDSIDDKILDIQAKLKIRKARGAYFPHMLGSFTVLEALALILCLYWSDTFPKEFPVQIVVAVLLVLYLYILGLFFTVFIARRTRIATYEAEIERLTSKKKILQKLGPTISPTTNVQTEPSYFDKLVTINVENLANYYALVRNHTDKSFMVSLGVGVTGFALIGTGLIFGFFQNPNTQTIAFISSGSGIVTEFIAAVFFYLYNKTVRQMKDYHDSLLDVQNVLLSFKIVGDTQNEAEKVKMVTQMMTFLLSKASRKVSGKEEN